MDKEAQLVRIYSSFSKRERVGGILDLNGISRNDEFESTASMNLLLSQQVFHLKKPNTR